MAGVALFGGPKARYVKYPFFFRTRDQFDRVEDYIRQLNNLSTSKYGIRNGGFFEPDNVGWYCQHKIEPLWKKVPKSKPGKKKYLMVLRIEKRLHEKLEEDFTKEFESYGLVPVTPGDNKPKYTEEDLTRVNYRLDSVAHFKRLTKMLNADYGHNNWHLRGQSKILRKLHEIEMCREHGMLTGRDLVSPEQVEKGLTIDVVVVGDAPTLDRKLFMLDLMK